MTPVAQTFNRFIWTAAIVAAVCVFLWRLGC
jgi:hypothetical protein